MFKPIGKEELKKISEYILEGMTEDESCILTNTNPAELRELKNTNEKIAYYLEKAHIEFKHAHLKELQSKRSSTVSQWLLEKLRPDEFSSKRTQPTTVNIIGTLIKEIQNGEQRSGITPVRRGDVFLPGEQPDQDTISIESALR